MDNLTQIIQQDYIQVGTTNKNCLKVLPLSGKTKNQKFVIGDSSGCVNIYDFPKGEILLDGKSESLGKEITRVELSLSNTNERERIFYSAGISIRGASKKGKEFFKFDTNITEQIKALAVEGKQIWTAGDYQVNEFESAGDQVVDKYNFLSQDIISDFYVHCIKDNNTFSSIIGCQDNSLRVLIGDKELYKYSTPAQVKAMIYFTKAYKPMVQKQFADKTMLLGLANGQLSCINLTQSVPIPLWNLHTSHSSIATMGSIDFTKNGKSDLLIAREDSVIELFTYNINDELECIYEKQINEAVTAIDGGSISNPDVVEFIASSYSGRIIGFQDADLMYKNSQNSLLLSQQSMKDGGAGGVGIMSGKDQEKKIKTLSQEITQLEQNIEELQKKLQRDNIMPSAQQDLFKLVINVVINESDGSQSLILDSQYPMELVAVQSTLKIEIIPPDPKICISSITQSNSNDSESRNQLMNTFRMVDQSIHKLELKMRCCEGEYGEIACYVIPVNYPMNCQIVKAQIKALSLHSKISEPLDPSTLALNTLTMNGSFSKNDMHMWVTNMLPDVPVSNEDEIKYVFKSTLVGCYLLCQYSQGTATFQSESISSIAIIKKYIIEEANMRGIQIDVKWQLNEDSLMSILLLLQEKFFALRNLKQRFQLIPALKELKLQEDEQQQMSDELIEILTKEKEITEQYNKSPKRLEFLQTVLINMMNDWAIFKGNEVNSIKIEKLNKLLETYDLKAIFNFIKA